jgi:hypothetical protein
MFVNKDGFHTRSLNLSVSAPRHYMWPLIYMTYYLLTDRADSLNPRMFSLISDMQADI